MPAGFTLIEVLVALALLSLGLLASLKVAQQSSIDLQLMERRTLAGLSAENAMVSIALNPESLSLAPAGLYDCPQATIKLQCRYKADKTDHPQFRTIEVVVEDSSGQMLANRFGIIRVRLR